MTDSTTGGATAQQEPWCDHKFHKIREADKTNPGTVLRPIPGIILGCESCGQIRTLFEDGEVKITYYGNPGSPPTTE